MSETWHVPLSEDAERLAELERRVKRLDELERKVKELEARPQWPVYIYLQPPAPAYPSFPIFSPYPNWWYPHCGWAGGAAQGGLISYQNSGCQNAQAMGSTMLVTTAH